MSRVRAMGLAATLTLVALAAVTVVMFWPDEGPTSEVAAEVATPRSTATVTVGAATATLVAATAAPPPSLPPASPTPTNAPAAAAAVAPTPTSQPLATEPPPPPPTLAPTVEAVAPRTDPTAGLRDKYRQPFSSDSIWNMPIGSAAVYVPAEIGTTDGITVDEEYWLVTDASMPLRPFYTNATFGPGRCETATYQFDIRIPDDFVVGDASAGHTPNAVAAILLPDGRTIEQMNPISRCDRGGPLVAGWRAATVDIYGPGTLGGHGGSHLSSIGGSLRLGELTGSAPIRHVLKVNLYGHRFLSQAESGFRWPATAADALALGHPDDENSYAGDVPALRMGSLLALPQGLDITSLGLTTEAATKLAWTLQNYGAYVVDDTSWDVHAIDAEVGVAEEFQVAYGFAMQASSGSWYEDMMTLFGALAVVDNNAPGTVGGGGAPRQPLAPPIGN